MMNDKMDEGEMRWTRLEGGNRIGSELAEMIERMQYMGATRRRKR